MQNPIDDMNFLRKINEFINAQCIVKMKNDVHFIEEFDFVLEQGHQSTGYASQIVH